MKSKKRSIVCMFLVLMMVFSSTATAFACTPFGAGKDATKDGSVLVSHTCDGWYDQRIQVIEGGTYPAGTMMDIYRDPCNATKPNREPEKVGEIPQAEKTNTIFSIGYPFMNDKQLMMGEFTWMGREEASSPEGLFVIANLEQIGLQRASTAREAIKIMGAMAEEYGYCDGGETLIVGDTEEVWVFEITGGGMLWQPGSGKPGAHWAAKRIPDDEVFVGANRSRIDVINFNDPDNYMFSTDITKLPKDMGWWKEGEDFHYAKIFNPEPYGYPFYASRREWRAFSLLAPSQNFELIDRYEHYPFTIKADEKITVKTIMDIYSDHLEGTPYDLTTGLAAGPFGNPTRWSLKGDQKPDDVTDQDWERSINTYRCSYSFVSQSRSWLPDPVGGVLWFGQDSPDTTVYVPIYCGSTKVPEAWATGLRHKFDPNSAWLAFNFVNNWANLRWDAMYKEIREKKASYEDVFFADQDKIEAEAAELYKKDPALAVKYVTDYSNKAMNDVADGWWDFAWELVGKYYDGMQIGEDGSSATLGYPKEYLAAVGFGQEAQKDYAITSPDKVTVAETPAAEEVAKPAEDAQAVVTPEPEQAKSNNNPVLILLLVAAAAAGGYYFAKKKPE